jgi:UDP-N-acetylmuramoyl-tripeptide--D-alanyl-D-alanine ligase
MMSLAEVIQAVNGEYYSGDFPLKEISGISTDTRTLKPGELFVALKGDNFNGHNFILQALEKGAHCVLVSEKVEGVPSEFAIYVPDTLKAYQQLAACYRRKFNNLKVIGVTGSCGKTITKDLIAHLLAAQYRVLKTPGNLNNEIGTPNILVQLKEQHEFLVVEMGMRGRGEVALLAQMAQPHMGVVTNVAESHFERLGSIQAIVDAKSELLDNLLPDGIAVLNADNSWYKELARHVKGEIITFGWQNDARVKLLHYESLGLLGSYLKVKAGDKIVEGRVRLLGKHQVYNLLAAIAAVSPFKLKLDNLEEMLLSFNPTGERMQLKKSKKEFYVLNDAYNSSPLSLSFALQTLSELPVRGRKIAVLGDMLELGDLAVEKHIEAGKWAAQGGIDYLIAVGELAEYIAQSAREQGMPEAQVFYFKDKEAGASFLQKFIQPQDLILLKASRRMAFEEIENTILPEKEYAA